MSKIETETEYYSIIVELLEEIYNLSPEENKTTAGVKNKEQPYELKIKDILDKYCVCRNKLSNIDDKKTHKYTNLFYEYQPNGSQLPPDFIIYCCICDDDFFESEKIKIECKSSKNNKPVWNCSIPEKDTIYVFYDTKNKKTYIFDGEEIIDTNGRNEIIKLNEQLKKLCNDFNAKILYNKNISYYPRQMINQTKKMDDIIPNRDATFDKIKNELLSRSSNKNEKNTEQNLIKIKKNKSTKALK
jgi:hypothetical protein